MNYNSKPVYLYDLDKNFICKFETTNDCAVFFNYESKGITSDMQNCFFQL